MIINYKIEKEDIINLRKAKKRYNTSNKNKIFIFLLWISIFVITFLMGVAVIYDFVYYTWYYIFDYIITISPIYVWIISWIIWVFLWEIIYDKKRELFLGTIWENIINFNEESFGINIKKYVEDVGYDEIEKIILTSDYIYIFLYNKACIIPKDKIVKSNRLQEITEKIREIWRKYNKDVISSDY